VLALFVLVLSLLVKDQFAGTRKREAVDLVAVQNLPFSVSLQNILRCYGLWWPRRILANVLGSFLFF
jgi:hypothetical protein